jgi:hypothetical protein
MTTAWTWLVYIATHNDVAEWGEESIAHMRAAQRGERVRVLVQQDTEQGCRRLEIGVQPELLADLGEIDSGDPQSVIDFIRWGAGVAPAERYALVLWSHGTGWEPDELERLAQQQPAAQPVTRGELLQRSGSAAARQVFFSSTLRTLLAQATPQDRAIAFDDGSGHSLDTIELGQIMAQAAELLGQPPDLLAMNACHMASVEVASQLRGALRDDQDTPLPTVYVATEDAMPVESLPYDAILTQLGTQPTMDPASLGRLIVARYCAFFRDPTLDIPWGQPGWPAGATLVAIGLAAIDRLERAVRVLSDALRADLMGQFDALAEAHIAATSFDAGLHLYDLQSFCAALAARTDAPAATVAAAQEVAAALADPAFCLARDYTAPLYAPMGGLTTYLMQPDAERRYALSPSYAETAYAAATGWGTLLEAYHALA